MFPTIRYVMNMLNSVVWDVAVLIAVYHIWGWVTLFWVALVCAICQTVAIGYMAEAALAKQKATVG